MFRFVLSLFLILFLGLIQLSGGVFINGLKPNLVLCFVIVASSFSRNWFERVMLVLVGAIVLKFHPGFSWDDILFIAVAFIGVLLVKYLRWQTGISIIMAVIVSTILLNIYNLSPALGIEIIMNLATAIIMYAGLKTLYEAK